VNVGQDHPKVRTQLTPAEQASRRRRTVALALVLAAAVLLFYILTIVKMGPAILNRDL